MSNRLDALSVRESGERSYFTKIGAAFENKDGKGWTVLLDAMPASNDGQFKIMLREPLPKDDRERSGRNDSRGSGGDSRPPRFSDQLDDDIAF